MSILGIRLLTLVCLGMFAQVTQLTSTGGNDKKKYAILDSSKLILKGTTNVNSFSCTCEDRFPAQIFEAETAGKQTRFQQVRLKITTRKFNCQNTKMERDLCKALKSDSYPFIAIELLETSHNPEHFENGKAAQWFDVRAKVKLTITNVSKEQIIEAQAKSTGPNKIALRGEKSLKMSDYGIDPPEALFGLIKVDDLITFHFNLDVAIESISE